jgi:hypothetical protein
MTPSWDPSLVAGMVKAGMSAGTIAAAFHISRNAVLGRVYRDPQLLQAWSRVAGSRRKGRPKKLPDPPALIANPAPKQLVRANWGAWEEREMKRYQRRLPPKPMLRLKTGECKWPVQDDPASVGGYLFCAEPVEQGSSYCAKHTAKAKPGRSA